MEAGTAWGKCWVQVIPTDVDFKVMATFLEFYQTLLQFVNFRLYHLIGVQYPPVVDPRMEAAAAGLAAIMEDLAEPAKEAPSAAGNGLLSCCHCQYDPCIKCDTAWTSVSHTVGCGACWTPASLCCPPRD